MDFEKMALPYHEQHPRGKIGITLTKPLDTREDLSVAYSPGVAGPCRAIEKDPATSFLYTGRANLVAVVTDGSAVLGLGNIGPEAAKPVMEGKSMLFKKFGGVNAFDIELYSQDPDHLISVVKALEPTFGGINLEDIKAPECFYIEQQLQEQMDIPVFHDDQHGTAIIGAAAFLNALELTGRSIEQVKVVFSGGGAAAIACADLFLELGVRKENVLMADSRGVIYEGRSVGMNPYKAKYAAQTEKRTLEQALCGADVFIGVSVAGVVTAEMVRSMAPSPIVFAMANPDPEITPPEALKARPDAIMATGRSDYPNQVNNVLGFPYIFRGALDVQARRINLEMKKAAVFALAELAKEPVPEAVQKVYQNEGRLAFGPNYLIPKPIDPRVLTKVAPRVAAAAMSSGVARKKVDLAAYEKELLQYLER
jgi:malate dehydrogenase (oxaloacetate-decarboxylating)(NADP+)